MAKIIFEPSKVWELFQKERTTLGTCMREIATDQEHKVVIMLSTVGESGEERPDIIVSVDDWYYYEESCANQEDCEKTVRWIYGEYLEDEDAEAPEEEEDCFEDVMKNYHRDEYDAIEFRENELDNALYDFLEVVLEGDVFPFKKEVDTEMFLDCKEHFLEYLSYKWDERIRRPMVLKDEASDKFFYTEYPYDYLEPEDYGWD